MNDNEILNLIGKTSQILHTNDKKRAEINKVLNFLEEQLKSPNPKEGMTVDQMVTEIHKMQGDLNKLLTMLDEYDQKIKDGFEERGLGVLSATAEAMKDFLPYF